MAQRTWLDRAKNPTLHDVIEPILKKHGFAVTDRPSDERNVEVQQAAYLAAIVAIAEKQPYYDQDKGLDIALASIPPETGAMVKAYAVLSKEIKIAAAREKAAAFAQDLIAGCKVLADAYRPRERTGGDS